MLYLSTLQLASNVQAHPVMHHNKNTALIAYFTILYCISRASLPVYLFLADSCHGLRPFASYDCTWAATLKRNTCQWTSDSGTEQCSPVVSLMTNASRELKRGLQQWFAVGLHSSSIFHSPRWIQLVMAFRLTIPNQGMDL